MNCLNVVAIALRLATASTHNVDAEPGLFVKSECGVEIGAAYRDKRIVGDIGFKLQPTKAPVWVRVGVEGSRYRTRHSYGAYGDYRKSLNKEFHTSFRASIGANIALGGGFFVSPEIEATRGGKAIVSIGRKF